MNNMFNNINDAISYIEHLKRFVPKTGFDNLNFILKKLNNPDLGYQKIHVAGTNGKGSTVTYLSTTLILANKKVGSFLSPYIIKFNERIQINNIPISDDDLLYLINYLYHFLKDYNLYLTFFEFITILAFIYFKQNNVDIAIMEVGIGGKLDATNVTNYDISLITNIGLDHQNQLGNTLEEIAYNKLGIIKNENNFLITTENNLKDQFINYINSKKAKIKFINEDEIKLISYNPVTFVYKNELFKLNMLGKYQTKNACLAIETLINLNIPLDIIKKGINLSKIAGRLEKINDNLYLDGAHNIPAILEFINNVPYLFDKKIDIIFGAMKDKSYDVELEMLKKITNRIIFTQIDYPRAKNSNELYLEFNFDNKYCTSSLNEALKLIDKNNITIILGSLYLVSEAKRILK